MSESYDEHRQRDEETIKSFFIFTYFFPSFRWLIPLFILFVLAAWGFNVLGESTVLNSKEIYYSGVNPWTGKTEVVKGCRPEHLTRDGKCDNTITIDTIKKAFPFLGPAQ
jgi:hypothetical protein